MDSGMLSIANAMTDMRQSQIQTAVQVQLLRNVMDNQAQAVEVLLQGAAETVPSNPNIGKNLDVYV